jgi:pyridoxamine 5'-phosphate oxidase
MPDTNTDRSEPFAWFHAWMAEAKASEPNDPNAMTLATVSPSGMPAARIVLLKGIDGPEASPRGLIFYTNKQSRKGQELADNSACALLFHWKSLQRQVRVEGNVLHVTDAEADAYYATRQRVSRLGAWASVQSRPLSGRAELERRLAEYEAQFPGDDIPRPSHWSGYRVVPERFEFWQDMPFRLHDRSIFAREGNGWAASKLFP